MFFLQLSKKRVLTTVGLCVLVLAPFVMPVKASGNAFINGLTYTPIDPAERSFCQQVLPIKALSYRSDYQLALTLYVAIITNTDHFMQTAVEPKYFLEDLSELLKKSGQLESGQIAEITPSKSFSDRLKNNPAYAALWLSLGISKEGTIQTQPGIARRGFARNALLGLIKKTEVWLGDMDGLYGFTRIPHSFVTRLGMYAYMNYDNVHYGRSDQSIKRFLDDAKRELNRTSCIVPRDKLLESMLLLISQM